MANDHSTGNERPVKIPCERQLTVGKLFYEYPPLKMNRTAHPSALFPCLGYS